jgi:hypothetical protein
MRAYKRLEVLLSKPDERSIVQLLRSGVQQVRVVLRSLALLQLSSGDWAPAIARRLRLTPKTIRDIGKRYLEGGVDRALYERPRHGAKPLLSQPSNSGSSRWRAAMHPMGEHDGRFA